jgi:hypothetical protein
MIFSPDSPGSRRSFLARLRADQHTIDPRSKDRCDYSLQSVWLTPAKVGDKRMTRNFGTGTRRFDAGDHHNFAMCLLLAQHRSGVSLDETSSKVRWSHLNECTSCRHDSHSRGCPLAPRQLRRIAAKRGSLASEVRMAGSGSGLAYAPSFFRAASVGIGRTGSLLAMRSSRAEARFAKSMASLPVHPRTSAELRWMIAISSTAEKSRQGWAAFCSLAPSHSVIEVLSGPSAPFIRSH